MKYYKRLMKTLCTALYFCLSSCNYLNVDEDLADTVGYAAIFQNKMNLQKYLWATAAFFPDEGAIWGVRIHRVLPVRMKPLCNGTRANFPE